MSFGQNVKRLRIERKVSQAQLAESVGVWQTYISSLENDAARRPSLRTASKIAAFFGVTVDSLNEAPVDEMEIQHEPVATT